MIITVASKDLFHAPVRRAVAVAGIAFSVARNAVQTGLYQRFPTLAAPENSLLARKIRGFQ